MRPAIILATIIAFTAFTHGSALPTPEENHIQIVGGEEATPHEFPWIVSIRIGQRHHCAGSIINENWILTAAHCVDSSKPAGEYEILAGDHRLSDTTGREQNRQAAQIIQHELFGSIGSRENDIAVIKLATPLTFNEFVQPAKLPTSDFVPPTRAVVAGWGYMAEYSGQFSDVLNKVDVPVVADTSCHESYGELITDSMICAGEGGKDSCQGDSGGPMMCESGGSGVQYVCGIVSWGSGCARPDYPGVYTEVSYFDEWIREAIC